MKYISNSRVRSHMRTVFAQTKTRRYVNQDYSIMDLGNHMNIAAKHWQVAAQEFQNIQHSYSLPLPVMKQSRRCFWLPLFWDFQSFLSHLMAKPWVQTMWLQRNVNMLSAFGAETSIWEAKGKVAFDSKAQNANITNIARNCKFTPGYHVYKTKEKNFCMLKFAVVEGLSTVHVSVLSQAVQS